MKTYLIITYTSMSIVDKMDCISSPCQHGGNCTDLGATFTCVCDTGYTGPLCESGLYTFIKDKTTYKYTQDKNLV